MPYYARVSMDDNAKAQAFNREVLVACGFYDPRGKWPDCGLDVVGQWRWCGHGTICTDRLS